MGDRCRPLRDALLPLGATPLRVWVVLLAQAVLLVGCISPFPQDPGFARDRPEESGPALVLDLVNNSNREVDVAYDYEGPSWFGSGAGSVQGCRHETVRFPQIAGTYRLSIEGRVVVEGVVPIEMSSGSITHRLVVDANGVAGEVGAAEWTLGAPESISRAIGDCT